MMWASNVSVLQSQEGTQLVEYLAPLDVADTRRFELIRLKILKAARTKLRILVLRMHQTCSKYCLSIPMLHLDKTLAQAFKQVVLEHLW